MLFPARSPFLRAWPCTRALGLASAWPPINRDTQVDKVRGAAQRAADPSVKNLNSGPLKTKHYVISANIRLVAIHLLSFA